MNALAVELLGVAKEYLGPAAPAFLSRELTALGVNANTVEGKHILPLAERARLSAGRVMDGRRAGEFAQALAAHGGRNGTPKVGGDHRLASDAAAKLFAGGRLRVSRGEAAQERRRRDERRTRTWRDGARERFARSNPAGV